MLAWRKGREAAQLETVEKIDRISGKHLLVVHHRYTCLLWLQGE